MNTTDLDFAKWPSVFGDAKMTTDDDRAAGLTRHCHIAETGNESHRFLHSSAVAKKRTRRVSRLAVLLPTAAPERQPRGESRYGLRPRLPPRAQPWQRGNITRITFILTHSRPSSGQHSYPAQISVGAVAQIWIGADNFVMTTAKPKP